MRMEKMHDRKGKFNEPLSLRDPLRHRLNSYVLAAGGVAILAGALPAQGEPVCRKISLSLSGTDTYSLNPANGPITPFNIAATFSSPSTHPTFAGARLFLTPNLPSADVVLATNGLPADLPEGASIGPGGNFGKGRSYGLLFSTEPGFRNPGNLKLGKINYFGYRFQITGQTHYGWVRMIAVGNHTELITQILESGYESSPDTPVLAGVCDALETKNTDATPAGSATAVQAGTLGLLALGARGLPLWRENSREFAQVSAH